MLPALRAGVVLGAASSLRLGHFFRLVVDWIETLAFQGRWGAGLGA